jgi:hypothetical protein
MNRCIFFIIVFCSIFSQCKKITSCNADICSSERITKQTVSNVEGLMGTYTNNDGTRWMIVVFNDIGLGPKMQCIICGDIADSLQQMNRRVVFSGELKDACGIVDNAELDRVFIVRPSSIR